MKTTFFLIVIISLSLFSCTECDDDNAPIALNRLYGTWVLQKSVLNGEEVISQDKVEITADSTAYFTFVDVGPNGEDSIDYGDCYTVERTLIINWTENLPEERVSKYQILELTSTKLKWQLVYPYQGKHIETFTKQIIR